MDHYSGEVLKQCQQFVYTLGNGKTGDRERRNFTEFKFKFVRVLADYEHYVPLSVPVELFIDGYVM